MNLALTADWLPTFGGAEHVIAEFTNLWPEAPLFTTIANRGQLGPLDDVKIRTSRLQKWYNLTKNHKMLLPWMPQAIENIDLRGFDVILSSSHAVGKGIVPPSTSVHICYCHTPMRYAWEMEEQYLDDFRIPNALKPTIRKKLKQLRRWDLTTAKRVDVFIANSRTVQERIERIYARESTVIHPPVQERFFTTNYKLQTTNYFLAIGRLVPYKRFDLLIQTANALKLPLKVAGSGQDFDRLKQMAGESVQMLGYVADEDLPSLYANAKALLFPQEEDAGVAPLEAQASGTPVIAFGKGGALDTVVDGETGIFFEDQTVESLKDAIERFEKMEFDREKIREHAKRFSAKRFREAIGNIVEETRTNKSNTRKSGAGLQACRPTAKSIT